MTEQPPKPDFAPPAEPGDKPPDIKPVPPPDIPIPDEPPLFPMRGDGTLVI